MGLMEAIVGSSSVRFAYDFTSYSQIIHGGEF